MWFPSTLDNTLASDLDQDSMEDIVVKWFSSTISGDEETVVRLDDSLLAKGATELCFVLIKKVAD